MRIEVKSNGLRDVTFLIADEGKVIRRIATGETYGKEAALGYSYYINGVKQDPPHEDVPEDFDEVDDDSEITPEEAIQIIMGL